MSEIGGENGQKLSEDDRNCQWRRGLTTTASVARVLAISLSISSRGAESRQGRR